MAAPRTDSGSLLEAIAAARVACAAALADGRATPRAGDYDRAVDTLQRSEACARVREYGRGSHAARVVLTHLPADGPARALTVRTDLLWTALTSLDEVATLPVVPLVKRRLCDVFRSFCEMPRADHDSRFRPDLEFHGCALAGCAALTRFPAGQLDWEVSGLPRSYLLRMPFRDLPRVFRTIVRDLRGLRPCFTAHMGVRRYPLLFLEAESHRSYHRMARSMALQPEIRGLLMATWLHSPETIRVSPHLSWTNRTPLANGAILTNIGPASPSDGFLTGSPDRQRLFDAGRYRPTTGLIIWPRRALLAWAAAHPEFGVEAETD
jgi:hypothetical protein